MERVNVFALFSGNAEFFSVEHDPCCVMILLYWSIFAPSLVSPRVQYEGMLGFVKGLSASTEITMCFLSLRPFMSFHMWNHLGLKQTWMWRMIAFQNVLDLSFPVVILSDFLHLCSQIDYYYFLSVCLIQYSVSLNS